jgi:hypothetical protein
MRGRNIWTGTGRSPPSDSISTSGQSPSVLLYRRTDGLSYFSRAGFLELERLQGRPESRIKWFGAETKLVGDEADGRVAAILSTEEKDRDGDILRAAGWDLHSFEKHPVLLSSHNYGSLMNQIGEWENVHAEGTKLVGVAKYYIDAGNPEADWGFHLAKQGAAAYSVGFIPDMKGAEVLPEDEQMSPWFVNYDFKEGHELIETSHVTVPSNRGALQEGLKSFGMNPVQRKLGEHVLNNWWDFAANNSTNNKSAPSADAAIAELVERVTKLERAAECTPELRTLSERRRSW